MKQRKSSIYDISSSSDGCNGHVKYFKENNRYDMFVRSTNGNRRIRKYEMKIDKTINKCTEIQAQMNYNRSQRCLEYNNIVQNNALPIYSKFAFHRIIHFAAVAVVVVVIFTICSPVNGQQQQELRQTMQNTGE